MPEVWLCCQNQLVIYQLQGDDYVAQRESRDFATVNLPEVIAQGLQIAYDRNTSAAIRDLKNRLRG